MTTNHPQVMIMEVVVISVVVVAQIAGGHRIVDLVMILEAVQTAAAHRQVITRCKTMLRYTSNTSDMTPHRLYHASCVERGEIKSITSSPVAHSDQSGSTYRTTFRTLQVCVSSVTNAPTALNVEKSKQF